MDRGTRLLLDVLAGRLPPARSILDLGCGVGVLGISLGRALPGAAVTFCDRDALALEFTRANCADNGLSPRAVEGRLGLDGLSQERFDLIVSNLPAKAGEEVLREILRRGPALLNPGGLFAVVVVRPLEAMVLKALGSRLLLRRSTAEHAVLTAGPAARAEAAARPDPPERAVSAAGAPQRLAAYIRGSRAVLTGRGQEAPLFLAAYGVEEFDSLGYDSRLVAALLPRLAREGSILFWNPAHGDLPLQASGPGRRLLLAGRDLLELEIARHNLAAAGREAEVFHLPFLSSFAGSVDTLVARPDPDSAPWTDTFLGECAGLLGPGGRLFLATRSSYAFRLLRTNRDFRLRQDRKQRGYRAVLLQKKG